MVAATKLAPGQIAHRAPRFFPGGRQFLFLTDGSEPALWLGSLDGAAPRRLTAITPGADSSAEHLAPGWLIRVRQNALVAQRFDAGRGQVSGDPITLAPVVGVDPHGDAGWPPPNRSWPLPSAISSRNFSQLPPNPQSS